jgi:hypothetical protein
MVVPLDRERLLAAVERSPQAAAAHDRAGWVGLFTIDGRVEDPVGSRPHLGRAQIGEFYDTFIGPRDIKFHRDLDIVFGTAVLRDLDLEVAMGSAVTMYIPAFLRYDLREANGDWQIAQLRAYWELPAMMLQFLRTRDCEEPRASRVGFEGSVRGTRRWWRRSSTPLHAQTSPPLRMRCHPLPQQLWVTPTRWMWRNSSSNSTGSTGPK